MSRSELNTLTHDNLWPITVYSVSPLPIAYLLSFVFILLLKFQRFPVYLWPTHWTRYDLRSFTARNKCATGFFQSQLLRGSPPPQKASVTVCRGPLRGIIKKTKKPASRSRVGNTFRLLCVSTVTPSSLRNTTWRHSCTCVKMWKYVNCSYQVETNGLTLIINGLIIYPTTGSQAGDEEGRKEIKNSPPTCLRRPIFKTCAVSLATAL